MQFTTSGNRELKEKIWWSIKQWLHARKVSIQANSSLNALPQDENSLNNSKLLSWCCCQLMRFQLPQNNITRNILHCMVSSLEKWYRSICHQATLPDVLSNSHTGNYFLHRFLLAIFFVTVQLSLELKNLPWKMKALWWIAMEGMIRSKGAGRQ